MSLLDRSSHFEFGENWKRYASSVDRDRIEHTIEATARLFPEGLNGRSFLDIGSGSGVRAIAALEIGAASVRAVDIDENSAATTHDLLARFAKGKTWTVETASVFDLAGQYDVVFSWGVLHHTGDMWRAIEHAASLVKPGGLLAIAIYTRGPNYERWQAIKRFYSGAPKPVQKMVFATYVAAFLPTWPSFAGRSPLAFVRNYQKQNHGMNFSHNVHDWLGGYPYEAATVGEIDAKLTGLGLKEVRTFAVDPGRGVWSAGCSEYVYRR
jgi:cyclopropane fatty-acyl-phospholipid synthase-like methyltransferase